MWIAFKLYLWHIGHNPYTRLRLLIGCELLSNCIFDILVTTVAILLLFPLLLWIAFKLYLWHIGHNLVSARPFHLSVVNCFQIVSLTYWSQRDTLEDKVRDCCESLSNCIFDILVTTTIHLGFDHLLLWIAFKLYLWHIGHNNHDHGRWQLTVVNCFQIVSLTYWSQQKGKCGSTKGSCELLSNCIFDILVTTRGGQ